MYKINNLYKTLIGKTTITFFDIELINIKVLVNSVLIHSNYKLFTNL